ncbi:hypothetical protein KP509_37G068200 [Ceratopteris richardii]|uniref:Uncharacterized protein n=1 Tax=Ceratopteris richardii TaxID=49495 RepID=A0A8T2Q8Y8_CERRI|nr:hypothetical protein KP509_37G068200 [Ceratopteris richardii]
MQSFSRTNVFASHIPCLRALSSLSCVLPSIGVHSSVFPFFPFDQTERSCQVSTSSSFLVSGISLAEPMLCGRGDKKTKKGKRFRHRFGNPRPNRDHQIRRIRERWEQPPGTPWPVPGLSVEDYSPIL